VTTDDQLSRYAPMQIASFLALAYCVMPKETIV